MNIFISYSSSDRALAERLAYSLREEGCDVFFDRASLPPGEGYDTRIREAIDDCDLLIFLLSAESVSAGSYALAELAIARRRWSSPSGRILPVMVSQVNIESLPPYLSAVTVLQPTGELVPEVAAVVDRIIRRRRHVRLARWLGLLLAIGGVGAALYGHGMRWTKASTVAPAGEPVKITGMLSNSGLMLSFDILEQEPVKEISYRFEGEPSFKGTGFQPTRDRRTGLPQPVYTIEVPLFTGKRRIEVAYADAAGEQHGPYPVELDSAALVVAETKYALENIARSWIGFRLYDGKLFLYFTPLVGAKNAFREIRYSVDDETLSQRVHFTPDWSGPGAPRLADDDETSTTIPVSAKFVAVQLVYADGSESEMRRFPVDARTE